MRIQIQQSMKTVKLFEKRACKKVISSLVKGPHMFTEKLTTSLNLATCKPLCSLLQSSS